MQESEFTAAMERAVASRGGDYTYPKYKAGNPGGFYTYDGMPSYCAPDGTATCLIGEALVQMGLSAPHHTERRGAYPVMLERGATSRLAAAARCAQLHQDQSKTWAESLAVYKEALTLGREGYTYGAFNIADLYHRAVEKVTGVKRQSTVAATSAATSSMGAFMDELAEVTKTISKSTKAMNEALGELFVEEATFPQVGLAKGGWVAPSEYIAAGGIVSNMAFNPALCSTGAPAFQWAGAYKKDHALVA